MTISCIIALSSLMVVLAGCGDDLVVGDRPETPPIGDARATVTGSIVDANGAAVPGAMVMTRATDEQATADRDGGFTIDVPADTTLTLAVTASNMATIPLLSHERIASLDARGANRAGGTVAIVVKSVSGASDTAVGATVALRPAGFGTVLYAPAQTGMPDPDPSLTAVVRGASPVAWAVGVLPHVSTLQLVLDGASQIAMPYSIDDVTWSGTFTVDPDSLTLLTLFTP
ncbi:MAG: hypothetical protein E6J91_07675 [Deltaproteobacteria bacterium]|nr:MAG: hypothetical protein E6J91_07675 [Deltaproteobacteria bacterium]